MKRLFCLLLALLAVLGAGQTALAAPGVSYMPGVTAEMSDASYWADRQEGAEDIILTPEEIEAFNRDCAERTGTMVMDLRTAEETFDGLKRNEEILASATDDANYYFGWTYGGNGELADWEYYQAMIDNCQDPTATESMPLRYAVAVRRTLLRVFPAEGPILDDPGDVDFDYQSISGVRVNEPLILYTTSADGKYYLARIASCSGWVPAEDVAVCADKEEWLSAWDLPSEKLLVVYGNKEYTDASNSHPDTARRMLTCGTALELVTDLAPDTLVNNRSPYHNYVVYLPVRRADGSYEKQMALIPETAKVSVGYLPLTMANIAMVALNNLGDAYGWGGMLDVDDCSGMINTIYRCFGLSISRNGTWQANMNIEKIDMTNMCVEEKCLILDEMPLGSALCFSGHEMMYLGKVDGNYYVVSTVSSIISPNTGVGLRTRDVMINTLEVKRGSGKTWLGALNMAFMPCYAKLEGKSYDFPVYQWYHDAVAYCLESGALPALDIDDTFGFERGVSRADLAQALWTVAGKPGTEAAPAPAEGTEPTPGPTPEPTPYPFQDVAEDDRASAAIAWAVDRGLMAETAPGAFSPDEMVEGRTAVAALRQLADGGDDIDTALSWAQDTGVWTGDDPSGRPVTRLELAQMLYSFSQLFPPEQGD